MTASRNVFLLSLSFFLYACAPTVAPVPEAVASEAVAEEAVSGECPQPRKTQSAPSAFLNRKNPLEASPAVLKAGKTLFEKTAQPIPCATCHGKQGNGKGDPDFESTPQARNFTCKVTMKNLSDGQLFWIIQKGSPNTSMPGFSSSISEEETWTLIQYIRSFAK